MLDNLNQWIQFDEAEGACDNTQTHDDAQESLESNWDLESVHDEDGVNRQYEIGDCVPCCERGQC